MKLESSHIQKLHHKCRMGNISPSLQFLALQMIHNLHDTTAFNVRQIFVSESEILQKSMKYFSSAVIFFCPLVRTKSYSGQADLERYLILLQHQPGALMSCSVTTQAFFSYRWLHRMVYLNLKPEENSGSIDIIGIFVPYMHHVVRDC